MVRLWVCPACGLGSEESAVSWGANCNVATIAYQEVIKSCPCGFESRLFVVNNDIIRGKVKQAISAEQALRSAEEKGLLNNAAFEAGIFEIMLCRHRGELGQALEIAARLVKDDPQNPMAWYNLGCMAGEQGAWVESITAYEKALSMAPEFADAWYNKSVICSRLGLYEESLLCLERYNYLCPGQADAGEQALVELDKEQGLFGIVRVVENTNARRLLIGDQVQGSAFQSPGARQFQEQSLPGPGALPESFYTNAWYMVGSRWPRGRGLMLGLGCGIGAVALLENFPEMRLQVLEIDPVIIKLARKWFPLVNFFLEQGRLEIIEADVFDVFKQPTERWDFILLDVYQGDNFPPAETTTASFIQWMHQLAHEIWINFIGSAGDGGLASIFDAFEMAGCPVQFLTSPLQLDSRLRLKSNWIACTAPIALDQLERFQPFPHLEQVEESLHIVRGNYRLMVRGGMNASAIKEFIKNGTRPEN